MYKEVVTILLWGLLERRPYEIFEALALGRVGGGEAFWRGAIRRFVVQVKCNMIFRTLYQGLFMP